MWLKNCLGVGKAKVIREISQCFLVCNLPIYKAFLSHLEHPHTVVPLCQHDVTKPQKHGQMCRAGNKSKESTVLMTDSLHVTGRAQADRTDVTINSEAIYLKITKTLTKTDIFYLSFQTTVLYTFDFFTFTGRDI